MVNAFITTLSFDCVSGKKRWCILPIVVLEDFDVLDNTGVLRDGVLPRDSVFTGVLRDGVLPRDSVFIGVL